MGDMPGMMPGMMPTMMPDMGTCTMSMTFHWSNNECILFDDWHPKNFGAFIASCIVLFIACIVRYVIIHA